MRSDEILRWVDHAAMKDESGGHGLHLTLTASFYYFRHDRSAVRRNIVECLDDYMEMAGDYLDYWALYGKRTRTFDSKTAAAIAIACAERQPGQAMQFHAYGARRRLDAAAFSVQALDASDWQVELGKEHNRERGISGMRFCFPLCYFAFTGKSFIDFFDRCASRLKPFYGFAGIGPGMPFDHFKIARLSPVLFMLARAMPAFEIEHNPGMAFLHQGLRPASWLTALGLEEMTALGGLAALHRELPEAEGFRIYSHAAGLTIRAGEEPLSGRRLFGTMDEFLAGQLDTPEAPADILAAARNALGEDAVAGLRHLVDGNQLDFPKASQADYPLLFKLARVLGPLRAKDPYQLQQELNGLTYFDKTRTLQYYERFSE